MASTQGPVQLDRDGPVARIIFNRPEVLNAFDQECAEGLRACCQALADDDAVRVVLLRGNGRAFMAGGDIRNFQVPPTEAAAHFRKLINPFHQAMEILAALKAPVVASVHGAVAGAGLSLAMAADLVIAADDTRFTMGYSKLGVSADGSISWALPRIVGLRRAMEMALLSDIYTAEDAKNFGMVNWVVPAVSLQEKTQGLVQRLAKGPTFALGKMKTLLRESFERSLSEQLEAEMRALELSAATEDFARGVAGFLHKKPVLFEGK